MRTLQYFSKNFSFFCPQKVEKTTLKSCSEKLKSTFFPYCPELPKRPNQKNSCSIMWLIEQLYIELGVSLCYSKWENNFIGHSWLAPGLWKCLSWVKKHSPTCRVAKRTYFIFSQLTATLENFLPQNTLNS